MNENDDISLPTAAIELRCSLDWLRLQVKRNPDLAGLCRKVGRMRIVRRSDLERIRVLLGA
jgi:hypothetical protein